MHKLMSFKLAVIEELLAAGIYHANVLSRSVGQLMLLVRSEVCEYFVAVF